MNGSVGTSHLYAVLILLACATLFFLAKYLQQVFVNRGVLPTQLPPAVSPEQHKGLPRELVQKFPLVTAAEAGLTGTEDATCVICLTEFSAKEQLRQLPTCGHCTFHSDCITLWLAEHTTCPVCRLDLRPAPPPLPPPPTSTTTDTHPPSTSTSTADVTPPPHPSTAAVATLRHPSHRYPPSPYISTTSSPTGAPDSSSSSAVGDQVAITIDATGAAPVVTLPPSRDVQSTTIIVSV